MQRLHLRIAGRVIGVFFRHEAQKKAQDLDLVGYARNTEDRCVEIVAEGEKDALEKLRDWAKSGPGHARVDEMKESWQTSTGEYSSFEILY